MRSWLVHLVVVALMALCAGNAVGAPLAATPATSSGGNGWLQGVDDALTAVQAAPATAWEAVHNSPHLPSEPTGAPVATVDPAPLDSAADVPALVDGPRPFPLHELQAEAPLRLRWAPPPRPFLEGLRRPPRWPALQG